MADRPLAAIIHNGLELGAAPDDADVLVQAAAVAKALPRLGYRCRKFTVGLDLDALRDEIEVARPQIVFNLVESLGGRGRLIHLAPALLERIGQPFTGASSDAMFLTTNKLVAKQWLRLHDLPTPGWCSLKSPPPAGASEEKWIVKSVWEDASFGIDDDSVVQGLDAANRRAAAKRSVWGGEWFAERFIEGREINVTLLSGTEGPEVLSPAEICFDGFPADKPRLVGYRAKWHMESFEYEHTVRRFLDGQRERPLRDLLARLSLRCWRAFGLRGYARVDFRVDDSGAPWVLEINANPCLSPDAGLAAALAHSGIEFDEAIARILADAWRPGRNGS